MPNKEQHTHRELTEALKQLKENNDFVKEIVNNYLEKFHIDSEKAATFAEKASIEEIDDGAEEILDKLYTVLGATEEAIHTICLDNYKEMISPEMEKKREDILETTKDKNEAEKKINELDVEVEHNFEEEYPKYRLEFMRKFLRELRKDQLDIKEGDRQVQEIEEEIHQLIDDDVMRKTSKEYSDHLDEKKQELEKELEMTKDEKEKKRIIAQITEIENYKDFKFLFKRIKKYGDKELESIKEGFFDNAKSSYTMNKFRTKLGQLKYDPKIYLSLLNLEEKYLDEKYHVFNNLFLFNVVRYVAYTDTNKKEDRQCVSALISNLLNLVYNKFSSDVVRAGFIHMICDCLDQFEKYRDYFDKENILHPNHPTRIARDEHHEKEVREMIYANLADAGYEVTDEVKALDLPDLRKFYDEYIERTLAEKRNADNVDLNKIIDDLHLNHESNVREKFKKIYLQYSEMSEEMNEKFNTLPIDELKEICKTAKDAVINAKKEDDTSDEENEEKN